MGRPIKHPIVVGQRFGTRVVVREVAKISIHRRVEVRCDCGRTDETDLVLLVRGSIGCQSCAIRVSKYGSIDAADAHSANNEIERKHRAAIAKEARRLRKEERRARVRTLKANGMKGKEIAAMLGMSEANVSRIFSGKR